LVFFNFKGAFFKRQQEINIQYIRKFGMDEEEEGEEEIDMITLHIHITRFE